MFCHYCGKEIENTSSSCVYCGKKISTIHDAGRKKVGRFGAKQKGLLFFCIILVVSIVGSIVALAYYDVINVPVIEGFLHRTDIEKKDKGDSEQEEELKTVDESSVEESTLQEIESMQEEVLVEDAFEYSTYGFVIKANEDLYYMKFTLDSMSTSEQGRIYQTVVPNTEKSYDLVCRHSDGTEEVVDQVTGLNHIGLANGYLFYSCENDVDSCIYGIDTATGEKFALDYGMMIDANGYALVYRQEGYVLNAFGRGETTWFPDYDEYLGMEEDWVYTYMSDDREARIFVARTNEKTLENEQLTDFYIPRPDDSAYGIRLQDFMVDQGDMYYLFAYTIGSQGIYEDGPIICLKSGEIEGELLVEKASGMDLVKNGEKKYLIYETRKSNSQGIYITNILDTETKETVSTETRRFKGTRGMGYWFSDGIYANLGNDGKVHQIFTTEELKQLGFDKYKDSVTNKNCNISVQEDGVYMYLCYGHTEEYDGTTGIFEAERGMLVRKNLQTGELTVIYEMTESDAKNEKADKLSLSASSVNNVSESQGDISLQKVFDQASLFTSSQAEVLEKRLVQIAEQEQYDVAIATTDDTGSMTTDKYARDFYAINGIGYGNNRQGVLLLIDMDNRQVYIDEYNDQKQGFQISNRERDVILDVIMEHAYDGNFYGVADSFLNELPQYLNNGE